MNIAEVLLHQAAIQGNSPALIDVHRRRDRMLTFAALDAASAGFAARMAQCGIGRGDGVLILHPMSAELYALLIGVFRLGAIAMFLDPSAGRDHIERCLRIFPPKAFFGSAKAQLLRWWIPALRRLTVTMCSRAFPGAVHLSLADERSDGGDIAAAQESDPALITFTSGSTGAPKAAMRTHGFLLAQHRALQASLHHQAGTFDLTTLPVFVLANLASGITSVLPDADMRRPGHIDAGPVLKQLGRHPITTMAASPAFVSRLAQECRRSGNRAGGLQRVFMGGAPVFPVEMRNAHEAFPNAAIHAVYGSTEAEPMAEVALSEISGEDFSAMQQGGGLLAGHPIESILLRVIRNRWGTPIADIDQASFESLCVKAGEVGEIVVSGDHVLSGYLNGAGDAETKFRMDGVVWHRTGDLGRIDHRGRLWLLGRASAVISDQRGILYPFAAECAAREVSGIRRAAVLALNGRRILAIETDDSLAVEAVKRSLPWAQIDDVRLVRSIPMDKRHNAKVDYIALRKSLAGRKELSD